MLLVLRIFTTGEGQLVNPEDELLEEVGGFGFGRGGREVFTEPPSLNLINADGECYLTQTIIDKKFVIRVSIGTFETTREDVMAVHTIANKFYNIVVKKA